MRACFWRVLEALGSAGSATHDWRLRLGGEWEGCRSFLRPVAGVADCEIDPDNHNRHLTVDDDGDSGFIAFAEEPPLRPPIPLLFGEVALLCPDWSAIADALGKSLNFVPGPWEKDGVTRQIGIAQRGRNPTRPVILHLPGGHIGDHGRLLRDLGKRNESIILLPSSRWLTPEVQAFRKSHNLSFVPVAEHFEAAAQGRQDFPVEAALELATAKPGKRIVPVLHPQPGWRWDMVRIEVASGGRLLFSCDGQHGEHRLPKTTAKKPNQALGIMMTLAVKREWRNPPSDAADHESVRKNFHRLEELLRALVPLPGKPFQRLRGAFIPVFQVSLHPDLLDGINGNSGNTGRQSKVELR
jgi:hypothetical protein